MAYAVSLVPEEVSTAIYSVRGVFAALIRLFCCVLVSWVRGCYGCFCIVSASLSSMRSVVGWYGSARGVVLSAYMMISAVFACSLGVGW